MNKDARELLRFAESNGFKCIRSHKHIVLVHGADASVRVTMSSTPSDRKNWVLVRSMLRRAVRTLEHGHGLCACTH